MYDDGDSMVTILTSLFFADFNRCTSVCETLYSINTLIIGLPDEVVICYNAKSFKVEKTPQLTTRLTFHKSFKNII